MGDDKPGGLEQYLGIVAGKTGTSVAARATSEGVAARVTTAAHGQDAGRHEHVEATDP